MQVIKSCGAFVLIIISIMLLVRYWYFMKWRLIAVNRLSSFKLLLEEFRLFFLLDRWVTFFTLYKSIMTKIDWTSTAIPNPVILSNNVAMTATFLQFPHDIVGVRWGRVELDTHSSLPLPYELLSSFAQRTPS